MSNRYGRRQRRAHRERIAHLEQELAKAKSFGEMQRQRADKADGCARMAEAQARNAMEEAFQSYARASGLLERYAAEIAAELGRALAPEVQKIASQIMGGEGARRMGPRLEVHQPWHERNIRHLRGTIGPIAYNVAFTKRQMEDAWIEPTSRHPDFGSRPL